MPFTICPSKIQIHSINHVSLGVLFPNPKELLIAVEFKVNRFDFSHWELSEVLHCENISQSSWGKTRLHETCTACVTAQTVWEIPFVHCLRDFCQTVYQSVHNCSIIFLLSLRTALSPWHPWTTMRILCTPHVRSSLFKKKISVGLVGLHNWRSPVLWIRF